MYIVGSVIFKIHCLSFWSILHVEKKHQHDTYDDSDKGPSAIANQTFSKVQVVSNVITAVVQHLFSSVI